MPPERVLIVEDDLELQTSLQELLESEGYGVDLAPNGLEALSLLRSGHRPAAVLLDLMMPVMNGYEFLAALRSDLAAPAPPIVLVSAAPDSERLSTQLGLLIVRKPFDIDELLSTLRQAIHP